MLWDVFCRVIDNFGDIGVCWRLCADLAARGEHVRLWADDARALAWMAPDGADRVVVHPWVEAEHNPPSPGDVVVEAFGCNPPDAFISAMQRPQPPIWINLEYLSAEDWVERSHRLPSPVLSGPGRGLSKIFFFPGFTSGTGGLLREPGLLDTQAAFDRSPTGRLRWLKQFAPSTAASGEEPWISLFCYGGAPVSALLDVLCQAGRPAHVLLTPGPATALARQWGADRPCSDTLILSELPHLPQAAFDRLLWCCDVNFVRGEDSAVRALWASRPHVWQIYPQDDGVHADKLAAFAARWRQGWPGALSSPVDAVWRAWNGLGPPQNLTALVDLLQDPQWASWSQVSRHRLASQADLGTQLLHLVTRTG